MGKVFFRVSEQGVTNMDINQEAILKSIEQMQKDQFGTCSICKSIFVRIVHEHRPSGKRRFQHQKNICIKCLKRPKWKAYG